MSLNLPDVMLDPSLLAPDDYWSVYCTVDGCTTLVQGGRFGLAAHQIVVHGVPA